MRPLKLPRIEALDLRRPGWRLFVSVDLDHVTVWDGGRIVEQLRIEDATPTAIYALVNESSKYLSASWPAVRPPGPWPWLVDQLLDLTWPVRWATVRWALRQIDRHGLRCRFCGLPLDVRDQLLTHDAVECVGCRRRITRISIEAARGRPVRAVLFGV